MTAAALAGSAIRKLGESSDCLDLTHTEETEVTEELRARLSSSVTSGPSVAV
jgi:hypothetical protein